MKRIVIIIKHHIFRIFAININKMTMTKETAIKAISDLPDEFELDDLLEKLVFMAKVEKGMQQAREGKVTPHDEFMKEAKKWSK
jgi:predicted transcriptional regulator